MMNEPAMDELIGKRIHIQGIVQGVGFRPFVYRLAQRFTLSGQVSNTSAGVDIEVDGRADQLAAFASALVGEAPPLARIDELCIEDRPANGFQSFAISPSRAIDGTYQPVSPDMGICDDCLRELFDPRDRRYRYPFINCTHCGPRFTIIRRMPYDRPSTTMAAFPVCPACAAEFGDPLDRRFHAQPVACPVCGPQVWLEEKGKDGGDVADFYPTIANIFTAVAREDEAIQRARQLLMAGKIVAVKGLGGFHLVCDATNDAAVSALRQRKGRGEKPLAVMMFDLATVEKHCWLNEAEKSLLCSRERPIVIVDRRPDSDVAAAVAPGQPTLGVMLPYTPLHYLLLEPGAGFPEALVMTSGNRSEEPLAADNNEARQRLAELADAFLLHNRDIHLRCDDSVVRVVSLQVAGGKWQVASEVEPSSFIPQPSSLIPHSPLTTLHSPLPIRRARGYAPLPVKLPWEVRPILATGAELKNSFCLVRGRDAFLSQHIGDLENLETLQSFEQSVDHFERLFHVCPERLAYDLHPNYLATRYALERAERAGIAAVGVQHHHAHVAACMAEHGLRGERPVIGVAFDGTGYGDDGHIWGGEFLVADYRGYERPYHLAYLPMPGGDAAVRQPWRLALAWLWAAGIDWDGVVERLQVTPQRAGIVQRQLELGLNTPLTSSVGRLFDAVAALIGVRQVVSYEAQAAIELEALVNPDETGAYPLAIGETTVDPTPLAHAIVADWRNGVPVSSIAARFHSGVAQMVADVCQTICGRTGLREVVLSGGVWQNVTLLQRTIRRLEAADFTVYWHQQVPTNDGGLALGQAVIAAYGW